MDKAVNYWKSNLNYFVLLVSEFYPLSKDYLEKYKHLWIWNKISHNMFIKWSPEMIEQYKNDIDWKWFCEHKAAPYIFQDDYKIYESVKWTDYKFSSTYQLVKIMHKLYSSKRIPINEEDCVNVGWLAHASFPWEKVDFYDRRLKTRIIKSELDRLLKENNQKFAETEPAYYTTCLPIEFIEEHKDVLNWNILNGVNTVPWCLDAIIKFKEYLDVKSLYHNMILMDFALKPYLNNEMIDNILDGVNSYEIATLMEFYIPSNWDFVETALNRGDDYKLDLE